MSAWAHPRWRFVMDMNGDGSVTFTDVWKLLGWVFHLPGDAVLALVLNNAPGPTRYLELSVGQYGGLLTGVISFAVWSIILILIVLSIDD